MAKHEQKEHLRRGIKKAREAAERATQESAAIQQHQSTQPVTSGEATVPPNEAPSARSRPHRITAPTTTPRGDFLERMAAREEAHRKQEDA